MRRLNYTPVKSRLLRVTGSYVVQLTNRGYMMWLTSKLQKDREAQQKARIEMRKLRPATIVPDLRGMLRDKVRMPKQISPCVPRVYVDVNKCKQLPELLLTDSLVENNNYKEDNNNLMNAENNNYTLTEAENNMKTRSVK